MERRSNRVMPSVKGYGHLAERDLGKLHLNTLQINSIVF